jgi:hypothetical protein
MEQANADAGVTLEWLKKIARNANSAKDRRK